METTGENSATLCHERHVGEEDKREKEMEEDQRKVLPGMGVCVCLSVCVRVCVYHCLRWAFVSPGSSLSEGIDPTQRAWYSKMHNETGANRPIKSFLQL